MEGNGLMPSDSVWIWDSPAALRSRGTRLQNVKTDETRKAQRRAEVMECFLSVVLTHLRGAIKHKGRKEITTGHKLARSCYV